MQRSGADGDGPQPLLSVRELGVSFRTRQGWLDVTQGVSFDVAAGERVGIVGESGCGKSVTGLALLGLLPPATSRVKGSIRLDGRELCGLPQRQLRDVRGAQMAMVFQEPMSALDPVFTVGEQIAEAVRAHFPVGAREAREMAVESLARVGIPLPARRCDEYPHQLSGGMRQRAMIAIALACKPRLLVADEPTTALDVTVQAQILDVLMRLSQESGTALLFITHDLGVVAETCQRVITMYAGQVVEDAPADEVLLRPAHPYTSGLMRSLPRLNRRKQPLPSIPGRVPQVTELPPGCRFEPRCPHAMAGCNEEQRLLSAAAARRVRCWRHEQLRLPGTVA
ncbi:MAG TPA: ABC transporter ATP-binding protein [Ramlibacter sp.]|nr:ABC transporter ATP-binding protein [Ramlibacter sp.]